MYKTYNVIVTDHYIRCVVLQSLYIIGFFNGISFETASKALLKSSKTRKDNSLQKILRRISSTIFNNADDVLWGLEIVQRD